MSGKGFQVKRTEENYFVENLEKMNSIRKRIQRVNLGKGEGEMDSFGEEMKKKKKGGDLKSKRKKKSS